MSYLVYTLSRLVLGTLYPAYESYKAVRTKDVTKYVSLSYVLHSFYITESVCGHHMVLKDVFTLPGEMDDVLDRFCYLYCNGDGHGCIPSVLVLLT